MPEAAHVARGCLVLADLSGYTRYLGGVELEHSHDILADLIGVVAETLGSSLEVVKLEGDAIFCAATDRPTPQPLQETLENSYFAFARRQRTIAQVSSCRCDACRKIPELNLKFVAHHGEFVTHTS